MDVPFERKREFVVHTSRQESEGNDPRCPLVMTYVNEGRYEEEASYQRGSWDLVHGKNQLFR